MYPLFYEKKNHYFKPEGNSWYLDLLKVNGVDLTNRWVSSFNLPPKVNGKYYISYVSKPVKLTKLPE